MSRIALSGAIAVGKSTLSTKLSEFSPNIVVHQEKVEDLHFLSQFYQDPKRYAFHSRIEFLASKAAELARSAETQGRATIFDRALLELVTFANVMRRTGLLSESEHIVYRKMWSLLTDSLPKIDAIIWVRCDTPTCLTRIRRRGRTYEQGIDADYLNELDQEYREWADLMSDDYEILRIDTTSEDPDLSSKVISWLQDKNLVD